MKPVGMKVNLVGVTVLTPEFYMSGGYSGSAMGERDENEYDWPSDILAEAAGRICYNSFHLPNEKTATNQGYLANIKAQQHYTVLEHASFTFLLQNVSRALLGELTRHRHHSFSVRSQRYCDESNSDWVVPPVLLQYQGDDRVKNAIIEYTKLQVRARNVYDLIQQSLEDVGETNRKTRNDAARYALPEGTVTELYVTSNGNGWIQFLSKRDNPHAAEEIRILAGKMSQRLKEYSPNIFQ